MGSGRIRIWRDPVTQLLAQWPRVLLTGLDILLVAALIYQVLVMIRGTRAAPMLAGLAVVGLAFYLARIGELVTLNWLVSHLLPYVVFALIVVFQSEIRHVLADLGRRLSFMRGSASESDSYDDVVLAANLFSQHQTGALIVIEREIGLRTYVESGVPMDARLSYDLLATIFRPSAPLHDGGNTGLRFYYLAVEDYTQGISFNGQAGHSWHNNTFYIQPSTGVNDNDVSGMTFHDIGDLYAPAQTGYGVILFTDSSHDDIYNNTFDDIYNSGDTDQLHPLYITHFSSSSTIDKNLRDRSNNNNIFDNTFNATGGVAAYLDDFCDQQCVNGASPKKYRECASYGNRFADNIIDTGATWDLIPPGDTYAGGAGCSIPSGQERLHTAGNKS